MNSVARIQDPRPPALISAMRSLVKKDSGVPGLFYTPVFRVSFPHLEEPWGSATVERERWGYSLLGILDDDVDLKPLVDYMNGLLVQKFGPKALQILRNGGYRYPLRPKELMQAKGYVGFEGKGYFLSMRSQGSSPPACVDCSKGSTPIILKRSNPGEIQKTIYAGCYAYAIGTPFVYDNEGKGVSFSIRTVVKVADGESLNRSAPPSDDEALSYVANVGPIGVIDVKAEEVDSDPFA